MKTLRSSFNFKEQPELNCPQRFGKENIAARIYVKFEMKGQSYDITK